ncbi:MAG: Gfo/Idh/MocA family oxidoreductase [Candidatus Margulisiibacteriota bacterium]
MKIKRLAVIGFGSIGKRHCQAIKESYPNIDIVLVRRETKDLGDFEGNVFATVNSIDDALKLDIQAAIIATPASLHLKQAMKLASNGIHLLIEKPISINLLNQQKLDAILKKQKIICKVGYVLRFDPNLNFFRDFLDNKNIGEILHVKIESSSYLPNWRPDQNYKSSVSAKKELGGGVLLELSHELDYFIWLFGFPKKISSLIYNTNELGVDVEDQASILLESKDGFSASIDLNFSSQHMSRFCEVITTTGKLRLDFVDQKVTWQLGNNEPQIFQHKYERDEIFQRQISDFISAIQTNNIESNSYSDGISVLQFVEKIYENKMNG